MDEVVTKHRAAVEATYEKIRALDASARTAELNGDRIDAGGARVLLDGERMDEQNALFIRAENLATPEFASTDGTGATHARSLEACGEALGGQAMGLAEAFDDYLEECASAEYLFVLRTHDETSPRLLDSGRFRPGRYEGDVLLFRLADGALLGGFRVAVASSASVMARTDATGNPDDADRRLESDLDANAFVAINDGLRQHLPGVIP